MRVGERYGEIECRDGRIIQRWRGSNGSVRLFRPLVTGEFLVQ